MKMKACPQCGHANLTTFYFCDRCRESIAPAHQQSSRSYNERSQLYKEPKCSPLQVLCYDEEMDKALAWSFIASMLPLLFQINSLENTLGGLKLFWISTVAGIVIGFALARFLFARRRAAMPSTRISFGSFCLCAVCVCAFLAPAATSMLNRYVPSSPAYQSEFIVTGKCVTGGKGGPTYFLLFHNGQVEEKVEVEESLLQEKQAGETVVFTLRSGFLGFPVIDEVE